MKNFRGRLIRVDANDYVVADTDSDSDSEVFFLNKLKKD